MEEASNALANIEAEAEKSADTGKIDIDSSCSLSNFVRARPSPKVVSELQKIWSDHVGQTGLNLNHVVTRLITFSQRSRDQRTGRDRHPNPK